MMENEGEFKKRIKALILEEIETYSFHEKEYGFGTFSSQHLHEVADRFFEDAKKDWAKISLKSSCLEEEHFRQNEWFKKWFGSKEVTK